MKLLLSLMPPRGSSLQIVLISIPMTVYTVFVKVLNMITDSNVNNRTTFYISLCQAGRP